jgi:hypothetical protein
MGFVGMRGKKEYDELMEEKRAPSGFFGMRGKKMPRQSGFFGMRGKKYPYEFRGKFVGVRGKKASDNPESDYYNNVDLNTLGQDLDLNQLMLLLTENDGASDIWNGNNEAVRYFFGAALPAGSWRLLESGQTTENAFNDDNHRRGFSNDICSMYSGRAPQTRSFRLYRSPRKEVHTGFSILDWQC